MTIYLRDANKSMNIYENFTYYFDGAKENKHTFTRGGIDLNFNQTSYHTITMEYDGLKKVYTPTKYTFRFKFIKSIVIDENHIEIVDGGIVVEKSSVFYYYNEEKYVDMAENNSDWHLFREIFEK